MKRKLRVYMMPNLAGERCSESFFLHFWTHKNTQTDSNYILKFSQFFIYDHFAFRTAAVKNTHSHFFRILILYMLSRGSRVWATIRITKREIVRVQLYS